MAVRDWPKELLNNIKCVFKGHLVSEEDQEYLHEHPQSFATMCTRCKYPLTVWQDPINKFYYYVQDYQYRL
jgi:hypothetical protein